MNYFFIILTFIFFSGCSLANLQRDSDRDGVLDSMDACKNTPSFAKVDKYGCAIDSDRDGVIDLYDLCKDTAVFDRVDKTGCTIK